jgi:hypothetical protein
MPKLEASMPINMGREAACISSWKSFLKESFFLSSLTKMKKTAVKISK